MLCFVGTSAAGNAAGSFETLVLVLPTAVWRHFSCDCSRWSHCSAKLRDVTL